MFHFHLVCLVLLTIYAVRQIVRHSPAVRLALVAAAGVASVSAAPSLALAHPGMHTFRLEGAAAPFVASPQTERFGFGGGFAVSYELRPVSWLGIEARYGALFFSRGSDAQVGTYQAPGLGLRLHPFDIDAGDLWIGGSGDVVITGDVVRPGLSAGVGFEFTVAWWARVGPFIRFHHVFQPDDDVLGPADASFLSFGASAAFGGGERRAAAEPIGDLDRDGILDPDDACPTQPEDLDGWDDADGCPDPDDDGDGVLDGADGCPREAEDLDGFADEDGCPDVDDDGDGVLDGADGCPREAEDLDGFADEDGCPDLDDDHDGVADASDACQATPETVNGFEDADGCPDEVALEIASVAEHIFFDSNRSRIARRARAPMLRVVAILAAHPEITRLRIEAHTDTRGTPPDNMTLSEERGEAVRSFLVEHGVDAARLVVAAHGETQTSVEDQGAGVLAEEAENRRVVFTILELEGRRVRPD